MSIAKSNLAIASSDFSLSPIARAWAAYRKASAEQALVRDSIAALAELDDAALADIGVHRRDIPALVHRATRRG